MTTDGRSPCRQKRRISLVERCTAPPDALLDALAKGRDWAVTRAMQEAGENTANTLQERGSAPEARTRAEGRFRSFEA